MYTYVVQTSRMISVDANNRKEAESKVLSGDYIIASEKIVDVMKLVKKEND